VEVNVYAATSDIEKQNHSDPEIGILKKSTGRPTIKKITSNNDGEVQGTLVKLNKVNPKMKRDPVQMQKKSEKVMNNVRHVSILPLNMSIKELPLSNVDFPLATVTERSPG